MYQLQLFLDDDDLLDELGQLQVANHVVSDRFHDNFEPAYVDFLLLPSHGNYLSQEIFSDD